MSKWEEKFAFIPPKPHQHMVGGQPFNFYPASVGCLFQLKSVAKPISKSLAVLFAKKDNDNGTVERRFASAEVKGSIDQEIIVDAVKPELLKLRLEQEAKAIEGLFEAISANETQDVLGTLIMDSLQEMFPRGGSDNPPPQEFMRSKLMNAERLVQFLVGVAKANKGMFGPLGDRVEDAFKVVSSALDQKLKEAGKVNTAAGTTQTPDGVTSKTESSGASNVDTTNPASLLQG